MGRRSKKKALLAVDIGGTKMAIGLWLGSELLASKRWRTLAGPTENLELVVLHARELLAGAGLTPVAAGVSGGGLVDASRGRLISAPNLPGWIDVPVTERLEDEFEVPAAMENDANACALAEWKFGAGRGASCLAFLTCSTGIGAGWILEGRIHRGATGLAGEVGHLPVVPDGALCGCGARGCLEAYASGAGIARRLSELDLDGGPRDARELVECAKGGDAFARDFLDETAEFLARGILPIVHVLQPDRIVLGTIAVGAGDLLLEPLRRHLGRIAPWPRLLDGLEIRAAALGADLGLWAARAVAESVLRPDVGQ